VQRVQPDDVLFPSARGVRLSTDGVQYLLAKHLSAARRRCPTLRSKRVTPHVLRHTNAVQLLHSGVDQAVIALWLHESLTSTHVYLDTDLEFKEKVLAQAPPLPGRVSRFRADDQLLAFLKGL
jgi:site-specific recombinase XerD